MPYLIDGHNVIAALPDIDLAEDHDEAKLVMKLRAWIERRRRKAIVIFDGGIPGGYARALSTTRIKVVFASRYHTNADRIIRERLKKLRDAGNWTVVSSDFEVLDNARRRGARVMRAQDFAELLSRSPEAEKEKPDRISAAEVEAWLKVFPEVETSPTPPSPIKPAPPKHLRAKRRAASSARQAAKSTPAPQEGHTTRSIGEQVGRDVPPAKPPPTHPEPYGEKPEEISDAEVEAWLQVFHDPPESSVPPPAVRRRKKPRKAPPTLDVKKDTEQALSEEEVDGWMAVFGNPAEPKSSVPPPPKRPKKRRKLDARLRKHKAQIAPVDGDADDDALSEEDQALWQRLYGEE